MGANVGENKDRHQNPMEVVKNVLKEDVLDGGPDSDKNSNYTSGSSNSNRAGSRKTRPPSKRYK